MSDYIASKWFSLDVNAALSDLKVHVILKNTPEDQEVHRTGGGVVFLLRVWHGSFRFLSIWSHLALIFINLLS